MAKTNKYSRAQFSAGDIKRIRAILAKTYGSGPRAEQAITEAVRGLKLETLTPINRARLRAKLGFGENAR